MLGLFSDLMKFTVVNESLSVYKPNVLYWELFNYFNNLLCYVTSKQFILCYMSTQFTLHEVKVMCYIKSKLLMLFVLHYVCIIYFYINAFMWSFSDKTVTNRMWHRWQLQLVTVYADFATSTRIQYITQQNEAEQIIFILTNQNWEKIINWYIHNWQIYIYVIYEVSNKIFKELFSKCSKENKYGAMRRILWMLSKLLLWIYIV